MVDTYHVRSLKRIHDQAAETLEIKEPTSSEAIADQFNELLEELKKEHPENSRIQQIETVDGVSASISSPRSIEPANESLREIKLRCSVAALNNCTLGLSPSDFREICMELGAVWRYEVEAVNDTTV